MQITSTINDDLFSNLSEAKIDLRNVYVDGLYSALNASTPLAKAFDELKGPMVSDFFSREELAVIQRIITHPKDNRFKKKFEKLDAIIKPKGFKRSGCGTNRVVYEPLSNDAKFCIKVALDRAGKSNNPDEIVNQKYLKPFVAKCFDISEDGNVGIFERVIPIENSYQMWDLREDIFKIMERFVGRFIIDDFGTNTFKNWGFRVGFGPVLLDYADMYILDPHILYCTARPDRHSPDICRGELDYDAGFNKIVCLKCGAQHMASEFKDGRQKIAVTAVNRRNTDMKYKIRIFKGDKLWWDNENGVYENAVVKEEPKVHVPQPKNEPVLKEVEEQRKQVYQQAKSEEVVKPNKTIRIRLKKNEYGETVPYRLDEKKEEKDVKKYVKAIHIPKPELKIDPIEVKKGEVEEKVVKQPLEKEFNNDPVEIPKPTTNVESLVLDEQDIIELENDVDRTLEEFKSIMKSSDALSLEELTTLKSNIESIWKKDGKLKLPDILPGEIWGGLDIEKFNIENPYNIFVDVAKLRELWTDSLANWISEIKDEISQLEDAEVVEEAPRERRRAAVSFDL